jgi:2-amino-4-hydroxy-6-hydroxymethyldihydropteridine diphosphokinase
VSEPAPRRTGFLGLGSNVGDRGSHLRAALDGLVEHGVEVKSASSAYETDPVGEYGEQRRFLNAVVEVRTDLGPLRLLDLCKAIEVEHGRAFGGPRHGPRPLDVDLLMLGDVELEHPRLLLPHPALTERRFVLEPLLEIEPDAALPDGTELAPLLAELEQQGVDRVGPLEAAGE